MKKNKNIIFAIIGIVLIVGIGVWSYFQYESSKYFTTENAKVSAELYNVMPLSSGKLVKINVEEGSMVSENQVIGRLQNGSYLRSPIKGQVVKSDLVLNQMLSPTASAAVVADTDHIYIGANIEETDIVKIKEGQQVSVLLDAYPGQKFNAHVQKIDKVTQSALSSNPTSFSTSGTYTKVTQLIPIKIVIDDNVNFAGLIGTNATVKIKLK